MRRFFVMGLGLFLTACLPKPGPDQPGEAGSCGAGELQHLVGQSEAALAAMTFANPIRVIHPGQPVTRDFRPDRLNFELDAKGIITSVNCG